MTRTPVPSSPEEFLRESPGGIDVYETVLDALRTVAPDVQVRTSRSQIAFHRRRGFAYLWRPGQYLRHPRTAIVLSIALPRRVHSSRFAEVAHPAPSTWMHHVDINGVEDIDDEVRAWLAEAALAASPRSPGAAQGDGLREETD